MSSGLFNVALDLGASAFAGSKRWLEIGVRPGGSSGAFTALTPRQELTPTPNAIYASTAGNATTAGSATTVAGLTCATLRPFCWLRLGPVLGLLLAPVPASPERLPVRTYGT